MKCFRWSIPALAMAAMVYCGGCQPRPAAPKPLPVPTTLLTLEYSPVPTTGPVQALSANPTDAMAVNVTFIATENAPQTTYEPVGSKANLLSSSSSGGAILPSPQLTQNATVSVNPPVSPLEFATDLHYFHGGRTTVMGTLTAAVPAGVTAHFSAEDPDTIGDLVTGTTTRRGIQVRVSRPDAASNYDLVLVVKDLIKNNDGATVIRTESATFNRADPDTAVVMPFRFDGAISRGIGILIHVSPGTADLAHTDAAAIAIKQIAANAATRPAPVTGEASAQSAMTAAVQSLAPVAGRRAALAFLADQTGASFCEDVAMEADDLVLAQLVTNIQSKVAAEKPANPVADTGWLLDLTALRLLAKLSDDAANGAGKITPELVAVLTNHTGEVGRHSSSIEQVLRGSTTRQELDNRLIAENTIFLEDSSPASRVRAFDWLAARHHAPEGFDPLADPISRRNALERAAGTP